MVAGDQHVDGGQDKESEQGTDGHAAHQDKTDGVPGRGAGPCDQGQWKMAGHRGNAGHQDGAQADAGGPADGVDLGQALLLEPVGELDDQDAVLGHQPHQGHESHLGIDVQGRGPAVGPEGDIGIRHLEKGEDERPEHGQRHGAGQDHEGIAKAVKLGREHQEDEHDGQGEHGQEPVAFGAELAGLAGIVQDIAPGQDRGRLVLQETQGLVQRPDRHAADFDRVELLEPVERPGHCRMAEGGDGGERHQASVRARDMDISQLFRVEPVRAPDLGNDLVAAAGNVKAAHEVAAHHGGQVARHLLQVESQVCDPVAINDKLGLGTVDLDVDERRKGEHAALHGRKADLAGELQDLVLGRGGGDDEFHRKLATAGKSRRRDREHADAGNGVQAALHIGQDLEDCSFSLAPGPGYHAAETGGGEGDLEGEIGLRNAEKDPVGCRGKETGLVQGGVGRGIENAEDHTLVLGRGQLPGRHPEHGDGEETDHDPDQVDRGPRTQGGVQVAAVQFPEPVKTAVDPAAESPVLPGRAEQARGHHRRQGQGDDSRDTHRAGQGEGEFPEQGAGQTALQADGRVDRGQGDGHGDDRAHQLAGTAQGGLHGGLALAQVTFHVFHHHDGVVHHQANRQDNGEQGEQVDGKAEDLHQEDRADERERNGHHRDEYRAQRAQEQEDDHHHDEQGVAQGLEDLVDGGVDVCGGIVGHPRFHARGQLPVYGRHLGPDPFDHVQGIGVGQGPDAHEDRCFAGKTDLGVIGFGAEHHPADIPDPDDGIVPAADGDVFEILHRVQVGVRGEIDLDQRALGPARCREVVVGRKCPAHLGRADVEGRHPVRVEPDAHGKGAGPEDVGALDPGDGREPGLDQPHQVVGDLVLLEDAGAETEIGRGEFRVCRLDVDHRDLGLGRQVAAHLVHLGTDLGQGAGGVVVQLQTDTDGGDTLPAFRPDIVDAVRGRDGPFQGRGNETAHKLGAGADIDGGDRDGCVFAARILAHVE